MTGVILAVLDDPAAAGVVLRAARRLAELSDATRINALLVRTPPETMISPSEEVLTEQRETALRDAEAARAAAVRLEYDAWSAGLPRGVEADWIDIDGMIETLVEERGRRSDWLVIGPAGRHDPFTRWAALRAALFATDRPVLVVPARASAEFGRSVAIAWRDDPRAAKAVLSALHCLAQAVSVCVLTGGRSAASSPPAILLEHGIAAPLYEVTAGGSSVGAALLARAHELGADMLVMGAYQHSALRELLLGGVTRHMLTHADLPILMRH